MNLMTSRKKEFREFPYPQH